MIVHIDDETEKELYRYKNEIDRLTQDVIERLRISLDQEKKADQDARKQNPYIVKSVIKYMASGLNKDSSITLTALDFDTDIRHVQTVFWLQNRYMSAINLYAKRYTCEKLKKAGLTAKKTAEILGVSENHVYKLMKNNIDFWFLKH